ncbi:MAG: hypothetical protein IKY56_07230 [Alistipes sp.]|nr:hypothetical protein [Alistipes sp.]
MKRLLSLILLLLVATSSAHLSYAQGLERRFLNMLLIYPLYSSEAAAYHRLVGDVESVKILDYNTCRIEDPERPHVYTITFNNKGDVVKYESKDGDGCINEKRYFHYASNGRPKSSVEEHYYPNGSLRCSHYNEIICEYNDRGQLVVLEQSGVFEKYQYNYEGKLMSMTFYYDGYTSEPNDACIYTCNLDGRIVEIYDGIGRWCLYNYKFEYDSNGRIISQHSRSERSNGEVSTCYSICTYYPESRMLVGSTDDYRVTYKYDARGSLIQTAYYKGNNTTPTRIIEHQIIYRY